MGNQMAARYLALHHHPRQGAVASGRCLAKDMGIALLRKHDPPAVTVQMAFSPFGSEGVQLVTHGGQGG